MTDLSSFESQEIQHLIEQSRFELRAGEYLCLLEYRLSPGKMVIYHTEVPELFEGNGLAARLTRAALEFARAQNLLVEPRCPYTAAFMRKHSEFNNLRVPKQV